MAKSIGGSAFENALLAQLSPEELDSLHLQAVDLPCKLVIYEPHVPIEFAFFPEKGMVSIVCALENGSSIEIGTVGREGMVCPILLMEADKVAYRYFVQIAGAGYRVGAEQLRRAAAEHPAVRQIVLRYEAFFREQAMQGMACNGMHSAEQRCCRWLLTTRDRMDSDDITLTHEFLALMLGVRRSTVSEVLAPLQAAGMVRSHRGTITILNREAIEAVVCECYWILAKRERPQVVASVSRAN